MLKYHRETSKNFSLFMLPFTWWAGWINATKNEFTTILF